MKKIIFYVLIGMAWPLMAANYSGKCGSSLTWSLDTSTGMLLISGSGAMTDYADSLLPWYNYRASVRSCQISAGVTHLSENMFAHCDSLKQVYYPLSVDYLVLGIECEGKNIPVCPNCEVCGTGTIGTAVDLGLPSGTKWADHNVGATNPEDYGCYFAWGETWVKDNYDWSTYSLCKGSYNTMTKYCTSSSYGTVDNKTVLESSDDAAVVNWGGSWRMPTYDEQEELRTKCTWTWTTKNGINGYNVKGPNGNSIFLPAAGSRDGTSAGVVGSYGYYWSSSLDSLYSYYAWYLYFYSSCQYVGSSLRRRFGFPVRPVCR